MWKSISIVTRRRIRSGSESLWLAVGASIGVFTTALVEFDSENIDNGKQNDHIPFDARSILKQQTHWVTQTRTLCEPILLEQQVSSLRRHHTIQQLEKTSTKVLLKEQYDVNWDNPLGEGAFGSVHTAVERTTGEIVAVKKISKQYTDNASFQREMDALLHIRQSGGHPNMCGLRENYDEGQYYYLVLDFVSGGEMFDHLCLQGPYSEADAARFIQETASALAYLHGINIVHGDIKPENLMLSSKQSSDSIIKIVDFGCAQVSHGDDVVKRLRTRRNDSNAGVPRTPAYCPPEVLESVRKNDGASIDPSFDMWALGVILYIMLTGVHPFDLYGTSTDEEIAQHILSRKLPPIRNSSLTAHLSDDALFLIEKLLQWNPHNRLTAYEVLKNPWVLGETARTDKISNSDTRLSKYKAFKSKLEAKVFADMVSMAANSKKGHDVDNRTTLLEHAFHNLDKDHKGYVTTRDLQKLMASKSSRVTTTESSDDEELSLSGFTGLMGETLKNRYYPAGHIIYNEGEKGNAMFFLNSGAIEIYNKEGFKKIVKKPGDFFGEGALISQNGCRSASIRCLTPVHVIEVGREYFDKFLNADYDLKLHLREMNIKRQHEKANAMLEVQNSLKHQVVYKDDVIFADDNPGGELYLLDEGHVDIVMNNQKVFSVHNHGDIFGEHSIVYGRPRNVKAICKSDKCKLHVLSPSDYDTVSKSHPSMISDLRNLFNRREFQKAVCVVTKKPFPENEVDLKSAFNTIDINHTGILELGNIRNAIKELDPAYTEEEIVEILSSLDIDDSGEVNWSEFQRIFGMD